MPQKRPFIQRDNDGKKMSSSLGDSRVATYNQRAIYLRTNNVPPMLRFDQNGNVILPVAQSSHANYEEQPVFQEIIIFHERIWHYGVPWRVTILADITGQIRIVVCLSRNCINRYTHPDQLYVYILPEGANFFDMINWKTKRPSTIGRRLIKMVETFSHNGYGAVLGPLLLLMYFNIYWYLLSVSNGEDPMRENCEVVCHPADHTLLHWGYAFIRYSDYFVAEWCPFFLHMEIEAVRVVVPASVQASMPICLAIEAGNANMMKKPLQRIEEFIRSDSMAAENLEEEEGIMAGPPVNVIDNIGFVKESQAQGRRCQRVGSKSSFSGTSMSYFIVIFAMLAIISTISANYHGAFSTCEDYINNCTLFALMTQPNQAVYWLALRFLVLYRSHMDVGSVCSFVIPDIPKGFINFYVA